jgi:hypothetical protein
MDAIDVADSLGELVLKVKDPGIKQILRESVLKLGRSLPDYQPDKTTEYAMACATLLASDEQLEIARSVARKQGISVPEAHATWNAAVEACARQASAAPEYIINAIRALKKGE